MSAEAIFVRDGASMASPPVPGETCQQRGTFVEAGPATDWIRLRVPLVLGEPTSSLSRVAAAADFGNGISWVLPRKDDYSFINPDLTVYLASLP